MKTIFFKQDCDHRIDDYLTVGYMAGSECEVDEEFAARAVASGAAIYSDIAEDDLIEGRLSDYDDEGDDA